MPTVSGSTKASYRLLSINTNPTGVLIDQNSSGQSVYGAPVSRVTVSNPSWRIQIAKNVDAGTAYLTQRQDHSVAVLKVSGIGTGPLKGYSTESSSVILGSLYSDFSSQSKWTYLHDLALTRLKRKIKTRVGSADALVPVAESRDLGRVIRSVTKMTTTLVETLIDIKRSKGASVFKYASDAWLTFSFGVNPLVDDTKKIAEAINGYLSKGDVGIRDSAIARSDWFTRSSSGPHTQDRWAHRYENTSYHHVLSYRYYCGGVTSVFSSNDYTLARHLGFAGSNLIPAFWELVPYSWVVDYFATVGSYLEDMFWVNPGTMYYSGYTRRYECNAVITHTARRFFPDTIISSIPATAKFSRFEFERVPLQGGLPHIGLRWKVQDEIGHYGVTKLLNLASVLIQRKL